MNWSEFYLICFVIGFVFSLISFVAGGSHWHLHFHAHGVHVGHGGFHGHASHAGSRAGGAHAKAGGGLFLVLNPVTIAAFLTWFGGAGYLLTRFSTLWFLSGVAIATVFGLGGAAVLFLFMSRVLISDDEDLDPADFEMPGVLGRISSPVRAGGTGEIVYSQCGTRRTCGARSETGSAIPQGTEVVVTRYDKGIAYVRLWSEMAGEELAEDSKVQSGARADAHADEGAQR
jgi:membrane protein implicated in regulation of membrane protease activity